MTTDEVLAALKDWSRVVAALPAPLGPVLGAAMGLASDAVKVAESMGSPDAEAVLQSWQKFLRQSVTDDWQKKIDSQFPHTD